MGNLSGMLTSNDSGAKEVSPWWEASKKGRCEVDDLRDYKALPCCHCRRAISPKHISIANGGHVFCPECKDDAKCLVPFGCLSKISFFLQDKPEINPYLGSRPPVGCR